MFVAFYKEYQHGRNRDNYSTIEIRDTGVLAAETKGQLLNDMFDMSEYHRKSIKSKSASFSYEYTSVEWMGVHEIDVKNTFYRNWEFDIDWDYDGNVSENDLSEMIANSEKGKQAVADKEKDRKRQKKKRKEDAEIRKQKSLLKKSEDERLKELHDQEEYERLKLKFEGDK